MYISNLVFNRKYINKKRSQTNNIYKNRGENLPRKILRVNMTNLEAKFEDLPEGWAGLGGRGMTSTIVATEVPPTCDPLGVHNKLVFAPGIVTGTRAPTSGRISVGGKSPLTGGIKEANAGTPFAQKLGRMRIGAIIVEGKHSGKDYYIYRADPANLLSVHRKASGWPGWRRGRP